MFCNLLLDKVFQSIREIVVKRKTKVAKAIATGKLAPKASSPNSRIHVRPPIPKVPIKNSNDRYSRPDAVAHYPFADGSASVTTVLDQGGNPITNFLIAGQPAKRRLAARIFEDYKSGKAGMRLKDVPNALKVTASYANSKRDEKTKPFKKRWTKNELKFRDFSL